MENDPNLHPFGEVSELIRKRRYRLMTRRGYLALLKNMLIMAVLVLIVFTQIFMVTVAKGTSMYPAVLDGDIVFSFRMDREFRKNDVVVYKLGDQELIGRVVAKGGDSVVITDSGVLYVNGTEQTGEIAFITKPGTYLTYPYIVPKDCLFILCDYRTKTKDSREFGSVKVENVKAKVVSILRRRGI